MQHSAVLVTLNLNDADVLRAERQIDARRSVAEQRALALASTTSEASAVSAAAFVAAGMAQPTAKRHRRGHRGARLATR